MSCLPIVLYIFYISCNFVWVPIAAIYERIKRGENHIMTIHISILTKQYGNYIHTSETAFEDINLSHTYKCIHVALLC